MGTRVVWLRARGLSIAAGLLLAGCAQSNNSTIESAATLPTNISTLPADISPILGAAASRRVAADNDGVARSFKSVAVADALGQGTSDDEVEFGTTSRPLTSAEREVLLDALAPREVTFVARDQAKAGVAAGNWEAALVLAAPTIDDGTITITSELWCGFPCSDGGTVTVAANEDGTYSVTKSNGGWIT